MTLSTSARNTMLNALTALLNSGKIVFQTGAGVEVATLTFGATAFGAAVAGVATANAITTDSSATGGTVGKVSFQTSGSIEVFNATVSLTGQGGDIELPALVIEVGESVAISALTLTQNA